jgi:glucokinase
MKEIVAADIGGTHVRFAIAEISEGKVAKLSEAVTLETADYASLQRAWTAFGEQAGRKLPDTIAISFAGPVHGEVLKLTNNPWVIRPAQIPATLGVKDWTLINDFSAVGHAIVHVSSGDLAHLCGPDIPLPAEGVISVVGPGTGLGVAHVLRHKSRYWVNETEGGHIDFAPLDALEDRIVARLRKRYRRVSAERVVSGPGLNNIYEALGRLEGGAHRSYEDADLWAAALDGSDSLAAAALDRFCMSLGAVAGDIALAQGGNSVVIAGGIGLRLVHVLGKSGFSQRFTAKGRFEGFMAKIPVKMMTHPQPGLLGAAAAFAIEHRD